MTSIVLIPGAWLGASAWCEVAEKLRPRHDVHPLSLTGLGERAELASATTDLTSHVRDVVELLRAADLHDVLLVGHSYGSTVAFGAVHAVPERIARVVSVAGDPPTPGASLMDAMPPDARAQLRAAAAGSAEGWRLPFPDDELIDLYYGDHALDATGQRERLRELTVGHPIGTWEEGLALADPAAASVPVTHVRCLGDPQEYTPPLPSHWEAIDLDTGHWPMLTAPAALAEILDGLAG
jgi:pimeloyl-ACP methyl ester carboxylesterase